MVGKCVVLLQRCTERGVSTRFDSIDSDEHADPTVNLAGKVTIPSHALAPRTITGNSAGIPPARETFNASLAGGGGHEQRVSASGYDQEGISNTRMLSYIIPSAVQSKIA